MPDIRDARSAALTGIARAQAWAEEWKAKWSAPDDEAKLVTWWRSMTPEMHTQLEQMNPSAHGQMEAFIKSIEEKYQWHK